MRIGSIKSGRIMVGVHGARPARRRVQQRRYRHHGAGDPLEPRPPTSEAPGAACRVGETVVVCELAYYTGEFAPYGESLTNDVRLPDQGGHQPRPAARAAPGT